MQPGSPNNKPHGNCGPKAPRQEARRVPRIIQIRRRTNGGWRWHAACGLRAAGGLLAACGLLARLLWAPDTRPVGSWHAACGLLACCLWAPGALPVGSWLHLRRPRSLNSVGIHAPYGLLAGALPHAVGRYWIRKVMSDQSLPHAVERFGLHLRRPRSLNSVGERLIRHHFSEPISLNSVGKHGQHMAGGPNLSTAWGSD